MSGFWLAAPSAMAAACSGVIARALCGRLDHYDDRGPVGTARWAVGLGFESVSSRPGSAVPCHRVPRLVVTSGSREFLFDRHLV